MSQLQSTSSEVARLVHHQAGCHAAARRHGCHQTLAQREQRLPMLRSKVGMIKRLGSPVEKLAACTIAVSMVALVGPIAWGGATTGRAPVVAREHGTVRTTGGVGTVEVGRWMIRVSLSRSRIGPLALRTTSVRRAPDTSSEPWIQHDVRVTNVGRRQGSSRRHEIVGLLTWPCDEGAAGRRRGLWVRKRVGKRPNRRWSLCRVPRRAHARGPRADQAHGHAV
jgi:hypothetical protein